LSCGGISIAAAIAVDESDSAAGQVMLLGGFVEDMEVVSTVYLVDLATGVCTSQPHLLHACGEFAAVRLPDGRIVSAGGGEDDNNESLSSCEALTVVTMSIGRCGSGTKKYFFLNFH
jgi:hypothetical protein